MKRALLAVGMAIAACDSDPASLPDVTAPPSRHVALEEELRAEQKGFSFEDGDWLEDLGDAPFYGLAWLTHRPDLDADETLRRDQSLARARTLLGGDLLDGDLQEKVMAALGVIEHISVTGDRSDVTALDDFIDRLQMITGIYGDYLDGAQDQSWAVKTYGPTAVTALVGLVEAQYAVFVGGPRGDERKAKAIAYDQRIVERAFSDLADVATGRSVRGFASAPGSASIDLYPNVAMLLLEGRLFRLTRDEAYRLESRALYAAIQPLKLSPNRYASPYAATELGAKTRDVATLSSQNYLALALMVLFEITGDQKFVNEADQILDGIEGLRGQWCLAQVHTEQCAPVCATQQACVVDACTADHCQQGLLHHEVDGRLANATDPVLFCSGCNLQTLYVIGYRRALAKEPF